MVTIGRGDVVLCDLNPVVGTEQSGVRPVVILQIDRANAVSPQRLLRPLRPRFDGPFCLLTPSFPQEPVA
jgi:hypothetical protein